MVSRPHDFQTKKPQKAASVFSEAGGASWEILPHSAVKVRCFEIKVLESEESKHGVQKGKKDCFSCLLLKMEKEVMAGQPVMPL